MDFTSDAWQAVARHAEAQLRVLRERNDAKDMDIAETNFVRGQIAAYKALLALPKHKAALTTNVEPE